jgi:hypothetical protein
LFLLAFVCYGAGSALSGSAAGTVLELLNSGIVVAIAVLFFLALRQPHPRAAWIYLCARSAEAILLTVGVVLQTASQPGGADVTYQLGMLALGLGSLPVYAVFLRARWLPGWLSAWGLVGYALLAVGTVGELAGFGIGLALSVPGGLFEVVFGLTMLIRGFPQSQQLPASAATIGAAADPTGVSQVRSRQAAWTAGLGLLLMAVLAPLANFGVLGRLVTDDAKQTTQALLQDQRAFQLAIAGLFAVACLDLIGSWALWAFFDPVQHSTALLAAWFRTGYAVVFIVAISHLLVAAIVLHGTSAAGTAAASDQTSSEVHSQISQFQDIWNLALTLFGVHLLLIGWLALRSGRAPRTVAVLVGIAGVGYLADSIGPMVWSGYTFQLTTVTFVGEVALMIWLLTVATRRRTGRLTVDTERVNQPQLT